MRPGQALLGQTVAELGRSGRLLREGLSIGPICPASCGAAGIAYFFYRLACLEDRDELLETAALWNNQALRSLGDARAFENPALRMTRAEFGEVSLYHTETGVHCVSAIVALARGDIALAAASLDAFIEAGSEPCRDPDLTLGRGGLLLGCAMIAEAARRHGTYDARSLTAFGHRLYEELWSEICSYAPMRECEEIPWLGIAHGWAGLLLVVMRWASVAGRDLPPALDARLSELAEYQLPSGAWPIRAAGPAAQPWHGWCNGSAGHVYLWMLAHKLTGRQRWLEVGERSGSHACGPGEAGGICCGAAGQAYALLKLYRCTGESGWLERARELGERGASGAGKFRWLRNSLYRGVLGMALLAADLAYPDRSCMPFFDWQREGAPARVAVSP